MLDSVRLASARLGGLDWIGIGFKLGYVWLHQIQLFGLDWIRVGWVRFKIGFAVGLGHIRLRGTTL